MKLLPVPNDGSVRRHLDDLRRQGADNLLLLRADIVARAELPQVNLDH
jgi:hypothetical protein